VITVTTGRNPSQSTRRLSKEIAGYIPETRKLLRGKLSLGQLAEKIASEGLNRMILIYRGFGGPSQLELIRLDNFEFKRIPPTILLKNVEFKPAGKRRRTKIECVTVDSKGSLRLARVLSNFLELPLAEYENADFEYSLHLSEKGKNFTISPVHLRTKEAMGFIISTKKLSW
jgi:rRNA maturation protein Rpf1